MVINQITINKSENVMWVVRYFFFVPILLIVAPNAYGQGVSSGNAQKGNLRVGLFYSFDANLSAENIESSQETGYRTRYNKGNFTTELNLQYAMIRNLALQSGVSYSDRQFTGTYYCNVCDFITPPQPEEINLQFLQVPILLKYYPYIRDIGFFGKVGVLNQFMIDKPNIKYELEGHTYSLSGMVGAGIGYNFGHGFTAEISAEYTKGLTQIFKSADYSYNILGVQLSFLKKI